MTLEIVNLARKSHLLMEHRGTDTFSMGSPVSSWLLRLRWRLDKSAVSIDPSAILCLANPHSLHVPCGKWGLKAFWAHKTFVAVANAATCADTGLGVECISSANNLRITGDLNVEVNYPRG